MHILSATVLFQIIFLLPLYPIAFKLISQSPIYTSQDSPSNCPKPKFDHVTPHKGEGGSSMAFSHSQIKSKQFEAFCDIIPAYISSLSFCCCSSAPSTLAPSNYLRFLKWVMLSHAAKPLHMLLLLSEVNGTST